MRDRLAVSARVGVLWAVLAVALAARQPPPADMDVPSGKPPPLRPGEWAKPDHPSASGTGFVVAPGRLLTNDHVVEGCGHMVARNAAGREQEVALAGTDRHRDLALLTVASDFGPPLVFRGVPPVRRGETVITYGFPLLGMLSAGPTLTTGDVSALSGLHDDQTEFQITAPIQPGNSGGPLLDAHGEVIGIVVAKLNAARVAELTDGDIPQNINFAVKATEALAFLHGQGVNPALAASTGPEKEAAEVGDIADPSTVVLRCYR